MTWRMLSTAVSRTTWCGVAAIAGAAAAWIAGPITAPPLWSFAALDWFCSLLFDVGLKIALTLYLVLLGCRWLGVRRQAVQAAWLTAALLVTPLWFLFSLLFDRVQVTPTPNELAAASLIRAANAGHAAFSRAPILPRSRSDLHRNPRSDSPAAFVSSRPVGVGVIGAARVIYWLGFTVAGVFSVLWLFVSLGKLTRLGVALAAGRRLIAASRPATSPAIAAVAARAAARLGCRRRFRILIAPPGNLRSPAVFGTRQPVILLPDAAQHWPARRLYCVLLHEIAHIRRGDFLPLLTGSALAAVLWPLNSVVAASAAQRRAADLACDAAALRSSSRLRYAQTLAEIARESHPEIFTAKGNPALLAMAGGEGRGEIARRVRTALSGGLSAQRPRWRGGFLVVIGLLAGAVPLSSLGLSPNGAVLKPLLMPVNRGPDGSLRVYRAEAWTTGNWIETQVRVKPSGVVTGQSHAITGHRVFGCSVGVQVFLLDRSGRVLFHTRNFARGLDAQWTPSDAGHDRLLPLYAEQTTPRIVRETAYIAIIHRNQSRSLVESFLEKNDPLLRPLPYILPENDPKR